MGRGNKKLILGNWKMNPQSEEEALELAKGIASQLAEVQLPKVDVGIAPPFVFLEKISEIVDKILSGESDKKQEFLLGAQDVFWEDGGAYTGEISTDELRSVGVDFVIIGHSERRKMGETDEEINKKIKKSLKEGLTVILCVGEKREVRGEGIGSVKDFISNELEIDLKEVEKIIEEYPGNLVVAYEPLWAISSEEGSESADPDKVVEMILFIKNYLEEKGIKKTKVLYGGSVSGENAGNFLKRNEIDGLLAGGASLDPEEFLKIIKSARMLLLN